MDTQSIADRLRELDCEQVKVVGQDVMCCCPFHPEREPSFGVHPDRGANCFACGVRFHDAEKMFEALHEKRGIEYVAPYRDIGPDFNFFPILEPDPEPLNANVLKFYRRDDEHFIKTWGITQEVVERRHLCIDPTSGSECFPIFDVHDRYWGMVERFVIGKHRRYSYPRNYPRRNILFGEDEAKKHPDNIWVVEGVRDLCAVESKVPDCRAVALGTARITDEQISTLRELDYENLVLCLDNDKVGRQGRDYLLSRLDVTRISIARYSGKDPVEAENFDVEPASLQWMRIG